MRTIATSGHPQQLRPSPTIVSSKQHRHGAWEEALTNDRPRVEEATPSIQGKETAPIDVGQLMVYPHGTHLPEHLTTEVRISGYRYRS